MSLSNITGHLQTGVIGLLLILSAMVPNLKTYWESLRLLAQNELIQEIAYGLKKLSCRETSWFN